MTLVQFKGPSGEKVLVNPFQVTALVYNADGSGKVRTADGQVYEVKNIEKTRISIQKAAMTISGVWPQREQSLFGKIFGGD